MKLLINLLMLISSIMHFNFSPSKEQNCKIMGRVVDVTTQSILLIKPNQDLRSDAIIEIPVVDGKFSFETKLEHPEAVKLFLGEARENGGGRYMNLFLEDGTIDVTIYAESNFDKNTVQGGKFNAEFLAYKKGVELKFKDRVKPLSDRINELYKNNQFSSTQMKAVLAELEKSKSQDVNIVLYKKMDELKEQRLDKSPEAKILSDKMEVLVKEQKVYQQKYMENHPTIVSYSLFLERLIFDKNGVDINLARKNYQYLSSNNPKHPYNDLALNLINAIDHVQVGKSFTDFSAPDLDGRELKLSDVIKGKVALLDLWATWCGPCIARSKTMLPVYNEYKDKGFTIIGVAGELNNTDNLLKFLKREKWPWLNLVELNKRNNVWQKYGIDNAGGGIFLIDQNGKIIAKDPTAAEVREELKKRLD